MSKIKSKINGLKEKLNLGFEKIGALSKLQRLLICFVTFALIGGAYYYFIFQSKQKTLKEVKQTYQSQAQKLATYKKRASELLKYEKLMAQAQGEFDEAMKALPDKRELPSLLTNISKSGSDAGLDFHLFQPANEVIKEFYKEIPVSIKVKGRYHQITDFFFQVVRLNRIVNINNVNVKNTKDRNELEMSCKAVTYMFVEKEEVKEKPKKKK